jgi:large subunit ribosomal protein L31e
MIKMAIERVYNIPLRKKFLKVPRYRRTNKAAIALREFIVKHMKSEDVRIGKHLNQEVWKHGIKNPPHHVKVTIIKEDSGLVKAELFGYKFDEPGKEDFEKLRDGKKKTEAKEQKKQEIKEKIAKELKKETKDLAAEIKKEAKTESKEKPAPKKTVKNDKEESDN